MTPLVVGVSGSRRDGSHTLKAVDRALEAAAAAGAETELIDLASVSLPLYHPDEDDRGDAADLKRLVRRADGVVLGSPTYHRTFSSTFKNFHDYCGGDEFEDTIVGLVAVAGGSVSLAGTLNGMRVTVGGVGGTTIATQAGVPNARDQFDDGAFLDPDVEEGVAAVGREVAVRAGRRTPAAGD